MNSQILSQESVQKTVIGAIAMGNNVSFVPGIALTTPDPSKSNAEPNCISMNVGRKRRELQTEILVCGRRRLHLSLITLPPYLLFEPRYPQHCYSSFHVARVPTTVLSPGS